MPPSRRALFWLAWWIGLFFLWVLLVGVVAVELYTGIVAAALAATAAEVVRAHDRLRFAPRPRWLLRAWRIPPRIAGDTLLLATLLWRRVTRGEQPPSAFRAIPFRAGGDDARSSARRALVTAGLSASPNTVVIGIDRHDDLILLHQLLPYDRRRARTELRRSL